MREKELREHLTCNLCQRKILSGGVPMFWTVSIDRHMVHLDAVHRQTGLAMSMGGNAVIAYAMGPDEEMTTPVMETVKLSICEQCAIERALPVAVLGLEIAED